jgi:uncharacterized delta-60 repeat protein
MTINFVLNAARVLRARVSITAGLLGLTAGAASAWALAPGEDGVQVTIAVSGVGDIAQAVVVDPDGSVVLAGSNGGSSSVLVRLTPAGALDPSFGSGGIAINDLSVSRGDALRALVSLNGGGYLACGSFNNVAGTGFDFVVARFTDKGALDPSFNNVGYVVTPFAAVSAPDQCNALALQTDGMIVAAGVTTVGGHPHVALARYTTGGALDGNFGTGGLVDINGAASANGDSEARALVLQPNGKLLVAGYATGAGNDDLMVLRLNAADGSPDTNFGTGGITRTPVGTSEDIGNAMVLQPDGGIVLAGSSIVTGGHRNFVLARYTTAGVLDPSFGTGGLVTTAIGPSDAYAYALTLMPWGRLVAAGSARINTSSAETDLAVVAYNANGSLDHYFGIGGKRMVDISTLQNVVYGLATDLGGAHFWAGGTAAPNGVDQDFLAIEFGLPDTIFRDGFETPTP